MNFDPNALCRNLWSAFGNAYDGAEFPLPGTDEAAAMTYHAALKELFRLILFQSQFAVDSDDTEQIEADGYFVSIVSGVISQLTGERAQALLEPSDEQLTAGAPEDTDVFTAGCSMMPSGYCVACGEYHRVSGFRTLKFSAFGMPSDRFQEVAKFAISAATRIETRQGIVTVFCPDLKTLAGISARVVMAGGRILSQPAA